MPRTAVERGRDDAAEALTPPSRGVVGMLSCILVLLVVLWG
jgi:hypothetical protein